jgi:hypothetical protein
VSVSVSVSVNADVSVSVNVGVKHCAALVGGRGVNVCCFDLKLLVILRPVQQGRAQCQVTSLSQTGVSLD